MWSKNLKKKIYIKLYKYSTVTTTCNLMSVDLLSMRWFCLIHKQPEMECNNDVAIKVMRCNKIMLSFFFLAVAVVVVYLLPLRIYFILIFIGFIGKNFRR